MKSSPTSAASPDQLLRHQSWMFALARRLVRDDSEADDVVQTTWLTAIERGPRDAQALPAWLASVVRNAARQLARSESRRRTREQRVAVPADAVECDDPVLKAESQRLVVGAVLELNEPYRTTVLLRYYEDLPPREIAKRMSCPVNTVRARLRRALAQLRDRLHERNGASWRAALGPLCVGSLPTGGSGRQSFWSWPSVAIPVVCFLVGWFVGVSLPSATTPRRPTPTVAPSESPVARSGTERMEAHVARLERRRDELRRELAAAPLPTGSATGPSAPLLAEPTSDVDAADEATGLADPVPGLEPLPLHVDWPARGSDVLRYLRLAARLTELLEAGQEPDPALVGDLQAANGPLAALALELHAAGVEGSWVNASFTAPEVQVRLAASALEAAELPLDSAQITRLVRGLPIASADTTDTGLATLLQEAGPRRATLELLRSTLTADQLAIALPGGGNGLGGIDLFGESLLWAGRGLPVTGGREGLRDALFEADSEPHRATFDRWWDALAAGPDADLLSWTARSASVGDAATLTRWAGHIVALARRLPPSEARERILTLPHLPIPLEPAEKDPR